MPTKKLLKEAPLVHAVIHLEFSVCPELTTPSPELINSLHERMIALGFPERIDSNTQLQGIVLGGPEGPTPAETKSIHRTLFRSADQRSIVQVSDHAIYIKTTDYSGFESFREIYSQILDASNDSIPSFNKLLLKHLGLRYVDVLVPKGDHSLSEFVSQEFLASSLSMLENVENRHSQTVTRANTSKEQVLTVIFEEVASNGRVSKVLPDNLLENDKRCNLIIKGHENWLNVSSPTYGILDIDHQHHFASNPSFDLDKLKQTVTSLYEDTSKVFWGSITDLAREQLGEVEKEV